MMGIRGLNTSGDTGRKKLVSWDAKSNFNLIWFAPSGIGIRTCGHTRADGR